VLVEGSPPSAESSSFLRAVRDHLGDLGVRIVIAGAPQGSRTLVATVRAAREAAVREGAEGAVWVDLSRPGDIVLYLLEPQTPRLWTRKLRTRDETPATSVERVGLVARWAVAALIEGRQVEMDPDPETVAIATVDTPPPAQRPPPPAQPPPPPPPPRTPPTSGATLGASYVGSSFSSDVPWQSGVALFLQWQTASGVFVGAGYRFVLPANLESSTATARISRHPAELSVGHRFRHPSFFWYGELGAILDYTVRSTPTVSAGYNPEPQSSRVGVGVSPRGGAAWLLTPRIWVITTVGLDVFFSNASYVVAGATPGTAMSPWALRPRGELGIAADLW